MGDMKAGRELDAMVAERVMGWRVHNRNTAWWVDAAVETGMVPSGGVRGLTCGTDRFSPSSKIADAFAVVEKISERAAVFDLVRQCDRRGWWQVRYLPDANNLERDFIASAPTAPLAICLAALASVGQGKQ